MGSCSRLKRESHVDNRHPAHTTILQYIYIYIIYTYYGMYVCMYVYRFIYTNTIYFIGGKRFQSQTPWDKQLSSDRTGSMHSMFMFIVHLSSAHWSCHCICFHLFLGFSKSYRHTSIRFDWVVGPEWEWFRDLWPEGKNDNYFVMSNPNSSNAFQYQNQITPANLKSDVWLRQQWKVSTRL